MKRNLKTVPVVEAPKPKLSREEKANLNLDTLLQSTSWEMKYAKEHCNKWQAKFAENPSYALEWSHDTFKQAARYTMAQQVAHWIELGKKNYTDEYMAKPPAEKIIREIHRMLHEEVMRKAKWPEHSTSVPSNEMSLELNARRAEWVESLERVLQQIEQD